MSSRPDPQAETAPADAAAFDLTVSIATYDRPALLERTLRSVLAQVNRLGLRMEILVTDNHPSGNGREATDRVAGEAAMPVRYQQELARNMSVLRNAGIAAARGALLAFIDDDEFADPDWTDELVGCLRRTRADIVVGPRLAVFASGHAPAYDPTGSYFARDLHLPPDAQIPLVRSDGKHQFGLGTGNSLFRMDRCFPGAASGALPFDLGFGNAGGEDSEVFVRLYKSGRTIVWAAAARVTETVPEHRTTIAYRLLRTRRETQAYVNTYLFHAPHPRRVWLSLMGKGLLQLAAGTAITVLTAEFLSDSRLKGRLLMTHGLTKLQWHKPVGYIDEPSFHTVPTNIPAA